MPTTTFQITINSDISQGSLQDSISLSRSFNAVGDIDPATGARLGVTATTGISVLQPGNVAPGTILVDQDNIQGLGSGPALTDSPVLYLKNLDSEFANHIDIFVGEPSTHQMLCARLYGGEIAVIPISYTTDAYYYNGSAVPGTFSDWYAVAYDAGTLLEYALFYTP